MKRSLLFFLLISGCGDDSKTDAVKLSNYQSKCYSAAAGKANETALKATFDQSAATALNSYNSCIDNQTFGAASSSGCQTEYGLTLKRAVTACGGTCSNDSCSE